jgi:hypothetical protein
MGKSTAMGGLALRQRRTGRTRLAPVRPAIAVSFHQLFLGGLLPSRARFRFASQHHSTTILTAAQRVGHVSEQVSAMSSERTTTARP